MKYLPLVILTLILVYTSSHLFCAVQNENSGTHQQADADNGNADANADDDSDPPLDTIPAKKWTLTSRTTFKNNSFRNGVDLSDGNSTLDVGFKISHSVGAYASVTGTQRLGSDALYQQTVVATGYSYSAADWCDLSADIYYYKYPNDSINALAGSSTTLSLSADFYTSILDFGLYYDRYFGNDQASFITLGASHDFEIDKDGDLTLSPSFSMSLTKYEIARPLKKDVLKTRWLKSSLSFDVYCDYYIGKNFFLSFDPMILVPYDVNLLKKNTKTGEPMFIASLGLRYIYKF